MRLRNRAQVLGVLVLMACGCGACGAPGVPTDSTVSAGLYTNQFFGLKLQIPEGWSVADKAEEQAVRELGREAGFGDNEELVAAAEAAEKTTFQLLMISQFDLNEQTEFNPNLILMAERIEQAPRGFSGEEYLHRVKELLLMTRIPYELVKETHPMRLGGKQWHRLDVRVDRPEMTIHQSYIAMRDGDYVLAFVLSGGTAEQMALLEGAAGSVAFE